MINLRTNRRARPSPFVMFVAAIGVGVAMVTASVNAYSADCPQSTRPQSRASHSGAYSRSAPGLAQETGVDPDAEVPPDQVEKYVAVYAAMQRDRSLTVEVAAAKEGFSVAEFRELERKIGRDEATREHVRTELQAAAPEKP